MDDFVFFLVFTLLFIVEEMDFFAQFFLSLNVFFQIFFGKVFGRTVFVKLFASFEKFVELFFVWLIGEDLNDLNEGSIDHDIGRIFLVLDFG